MSLQLAMATRVSQFKALTQNLPHSARLDEFSISTSVEVVTPWWPLTLIVTTSKIFSTSITLVSQVIPPDPKIGLILKFA